MQTHVSVPCLISVSLLIAMLSLVNAETCDKNNGKKRLCRTIGKTPDEIRPMINLDEERRCVCKDYRYKRCSESPVSLVIHFSGDNY